MVFLEAASDSLFNNLKISHLRNESSEINRQIFYTYIKYHK
jgi:hypothetical protein